MKKLLLAMTAMLLVSGAAYAKEDKPDYLNNKEDYVCDNDQLADHLKVLYSDPDDVIRVIYVKGAKELSRTADGLRCQITLVATRGRLDGVVHYQYEDGHALYGFKPGRARK